MTGLGQKETCGSIARLHAIPGEYTPDEDIGKNTKMVNLVDIF